MCLAKRDPRIRVSVPFVIFVAEEKPDEKTKGKSWQAAYAGTSTNNPVALIGYVISQGEFWEWFHMIQWRTFMMLSSKWGAEKQNSHLPKISKLFFW